MSSDLISTSAILIHHEYDYIIQIYMHTRSLFSLLVELERSVTNSVLAMKDM